MTEDIAIAQIDDILGNSGFVVSRVPKHGKEKRPDLSVRTCEGDELYLVEVKVKEDNPDQRKADEKFKDAEFFHRSQPLKSRSVYSRILKHGLEQIEDHPDSEIAMKVVWVTCFGVWAYANSDALFKSLYGVESIARTDAYEEWIRPCCYFRYSEFERLPELDAVASLEGRTLHLFINEFSPRYQRILGSRLASAFPGAVYDPPRKVVEGEAYSLRDYNGDRNDEAKCLQELARRQNVGSMMVFDMAEMHTVANLRSQANAAQRNRDPDRDCPTNDSVQ